MYEMMHRHLVFNLIITYAICVHDVIMCRLNVYDAFAAGSHLMRAQHCYYVHAPLFME